MRKLFLLHGIVGTAVVLQRVSAEKTAAPSYMQIFYEGPGWLSGRWVLVYSPAFRGKTEMVVAEPDSVRRVSPNGFMEGAGDDTGARTTTSYATVSTEKGTFIPDRNGKMHLETAAERRLTRQRELAQQNRTLKLQETRTDLGKAALLNALNEAAADGWQVVQLAPTGSQGGLVYLLQRKPN